MPTIEIKGNKVIQEHDLTRVIAGYKSTLSNERTSEEAKKNARERIAELESPRHTQEHHDEHYRRVVGGYKAALKNEHVSEERKKEIRARLKEMGEKFEA